MATWLEAMKAEYDKNDADIWREPLIEHRRALLEIGVPEDELVDSDFGRILIRSCGVTITVGRDIIHAIDADDPAIAADGYFSRRELRPAALYSAINSVASRRKPYCIAKELPFAELHDFVNRVSKQGYTLHTVAFSEYDGVRWAQLVMVQS